MIIAFALMEVALFSTGDAETIFRLVQGVSWLLIPGAFVIVNGLASPIAHRARSRAAPYAGLLLLAAANAVIVEPMRCIGRYYAEGGLIESAALVPRPGFAGLPHRVLQPQELLFSRCQGEMGPGDCHGAALVTSDKRIRAGRHGWTLW